MSTATLHSATPLSHLALFRSFSARLSERQRTALSELAAGRPILAAAAAAGVHRSTLHGWLSHCEDFQAAYAALCRHQSEADSDLAAIARASLQALITDPATPAELRLRAIQTALRLVQSRPATPLPPALERPPAAPLPAVAEPGRGSSHSGGGTAEEGTPTAHATERAAMLATLRAARERIARELPAARINQGTQIPAVAHPPAAAAPGQPAVPPPSPPPPAPALLESLEAQAPKPVATPAAKATVARNAPCPCGSKLKFKRCCGIDAPPVLHAA